MGPLPRRLASRGSSGKAVGKVAGRERAAHPPPRCDCRERLKHEGAAFEAVMGDVQPPRPEAPAAPQGDVEVEDSRRPMFATPPAELSLHRFDTLKHFGRIEIAFDEHDCIGKIAPRAADCSVENDRRRVEQSKFFVKPCDRRFHDLRRPSVLAVGPVRTNRDSVKVRCVSHGRSPRS